MACLSQIKKADIQCHKGVSDQQWAMPLSLWQELLKILDEQSLRLRDPYSHMSFEYSDKSGSLLARLLHPRPNNHFIMTLRFPIISITHRNLDTVYTFRSFYMAWFNIHY